MPRPLSGGVQKKALKKGTMAYLRVTHEGRRYSLTLGLEEDGWTDERCEAFRKALVEDIKAGRWVPPTSVRKNRRLALTAAPRARTADHAYSNIRKAAQALEQVRDATRSSVVRLAAKDALSALYVAEDAVGRALRESA